jgi:hypothetical protein
MCTGIKMKKLFLLYFILINSTLLSQSLINSYNFPSYNPYNYFWGITHIGNDLWIATDYDGTGYPYSMMYKVTKTGIVLDSVVSPFKFNHGLAWDGINFWWAQDYYSSGAKIYKISPSGAKLDSIILPSLIGGASSGIGDIEIRGNSLWFALYTPDFTTYPNAYAYVMDLTTKQITDTIPLRGRQVQGITVKGDTVFYVNDNFQNTERIYAYRKTTGDTIFSFRVPDPDVNCNPKGLHWDGQYLWLLAERVGGTSWVFKALYKYDLITQGWGTISSTTSLPFGDVTVGSPQNQPLSISNTGDANLRIDSIKINNSLFSYTPTDFPHIISSGQNKTYTVTFNPIVFGDQTAEMKVYSNDPVFPIKIIQLTGRGVYGTTFIQFSSEDLNFNGKRKNSTSYIQLKIYNKGTQTLRVDSFAINNPNFYLRNFTLPINIPYTDSASIRVWFRPTAWLNYMDTIKVYSTAVNGSVKKIVVRGFTAAFDSTLGNIVWSGLVPDNPNTSSDDYTARYVKRIKDINADGIDDIVVTTDNYFVVAYNGNSSANEDILWTFNLAPNNYNTGNVDYSQGLQFIDDISGDNINDVVVGTGGGSESVIAINGVTGQKIWEYGDSVNYNNGDVWALDVQRDFNNDGKKDVLASISGNETSGQGRFSVFCLNGMNGDILWQINQASEWKLKYAITSTDDGGAVGSRVAGGNPGQVIGFNKQGQIIWTYNSSASPWGLIEIPNIGGSPTSDVIMGGFDGKVTALAGNNGQQLWQYNLGNVIIEDLFLCPDVNGNAYPEVLVSALTPSCFLIDGFTGLLIWSAPTGGNTLGAGVLGDLTGDYKPEVASADLGNLLKVFNGTNGSSIFTFPFGTGGNSTAAECVWIADDIDKNGSFEFAAGSRDGRVVVFSGGLNGTIPVEMTSFSANVNGPYVNLIWTTASEKNNKGFFIERSDFIQQESGWQNVGFVDGYGTTTELKHYSFVDKDVKPGKYFYRLKQIDLDGTFEYSKEIEIEVGLPIQFALEQNYPNPFNPSTIIKYSLPVTSKVSLKVFDILGNEVITLVKDEIKESGYHEIEFDSHKINMSSGIYFYKFETEKFISVKKMMFIK